MTHSDYPQKHAQKHAKLHVKTVSKEFISGFIQNKQKWFSLLSNLKTAPVSRTVPTLLTLAMAFYVQVSPAAVPLPTTNTPAGAATTGSLNGISPGASPANASEPARPGAQSSATNGISGGATAQPAQQGTLQSVTIKPNSVTPNYAAPAPSLATGTAPDEAVPNLDNPSPAQQGQISGRGPASLPAPQPSTPANAPTANSGGPSGSPGAPAGTTGPGPSSAPSGPSASF